MTVDLSIGASSSRTSDWQAIDWPKARRHVRRLQLRIAKAIRADKHGKAKALSWLLTHSRLAKLLAVFRSSSARRTASRAVVRKARLRRTWKYATATSLATVW